MADRIAVMRDGRIEQVATPARDLRQARQPVRRELHRHAADEPDRPSSPAIDGDGRASASTSRRSRLALPTAAATRLRRAARRSRWASARAPSSWPPRPGPARSRPRPTSSSPWVPRPWCTRSSAAATSASWSTAGSGSRQGDRLHLRAEARPGARVRRGRQADRRHEHGAAPAAACRRAPPGGSRPRSSRLCLRRPGPDLPAVLQARCRASAWGWSCWAASPSTWCRCASPAGPRATCPRAAVIVAVIFVVVARRWRWLSAYLYGLYLAAQRAAEPAPTTKARMECSAMLAAKCPIFRLGAARTQP